MASALASRARCCAARSDPRSFWDQGARAARRPCAADAPAGFSMLPAAFLREFNSGIWQTSVVLSLGHYIVGLACGVGAGVCLGVGTGLWGWFEETLAWVVRVLRPIPASPGCLSPFYGSASNRRRPSSSSRSAYSGSSFSPRRARSAASTAISSNWPRPSAFAAREKLVKVLLPAAAPGILVGVRTALGQAWMAVVAAELFGVAGLGQRMNQASSLLATDIVVVYMLTMAALYGIVDTLFVAAQSRLLAWKA